MALKISDKQLQALDEQQFPAVIVHDVRKNKGYAVMPEQVYDRARPLLEFAATQGDIAAGVPDTWTEAKNARRVALVNKKHDSELSADEERELSALQEEVCRHQEFVAPLNNRALALIVEALDRRADEEMTRPR